MILEGLGSSLNDGMVNPTGAHFQVLNALDTAMAPSEIIAIVERCPSWRASGLFVRGCKVRKVQPTKEGAFELEYRFKLTRPSTGDKVRATIVGKIYPDEEGKQEYKKILESLKGQGPLVADSALTGFVQYVPELRLLLASPSADAKLPSLRVALDPHAIKPFLADCLNRSMHRKESLSGCEVDILRYRPGKRCVLRYRLGASRLEAGDVHERSFIGKAYGNRADGADVFAIMLGLYRNRFGRDSSDGIRIPEPLGYIPELHMVLMEDVPSPSLAKSFSSPHVIDDLQAAARALGKIHACPSTVDKKYEVEEEVSSLEQWVARAVQLYPDLAGSFESCLRGISESAHHIRCPEPVLVHGDFWHKQVLIGRNEVTIVDFDTIGNADPARDVGNFLAYLKYTGAELRWTEEETRRYAEVFLAAYRLPTPPALKTGIDFYYRASLLRLACVVSRQPKEWGPRASLLAESLRSRVDSAALPV